jgi:hypothetical protein
MDDQTTWRIFVGFMAYIFGIAMYETSMSKMLNVTINLIIATVVFVSLKIIYGSW